MKVEEKDVRKAARLARIGLAGTDLQQMQTELEAIFDWIATLSEVDIDGIDPMTSPLDPNMPERPDTVTETDQSQSILANAPSVADGFFVVPKTVE